MRKYVVCVGERDAAACLGEYTADEILILWESGVIRAGVWVDEIKEMDREDRDGDHE